MGTDNCYKRKRAFVGVLIVLALATCGGCPQTSQDAPQGPPQQESKSTDSAAESPESIASVLAEKTKFKHGNGETAWSIKRKDDGAKLVDAAEQELARITVHGHKVKIKNPQDVVLGWISKTETKYKILPSESEVALFSLQPQDDGDWKLEDSQGQLICKLKKRDYGYEAEDPSERSLFKVKHDGGKRSLRDASDHTVLYTNDAFSTLGVAVMGLDFIESLPLRAALATILALNGE